MVSERAWSRILGLLAPVRLSVDRPKLTPDCTTALTFVKYAGDPLLKNVKGSTCTLAPLDFNRSKSAELSAVAPSKVCTLGPSTPIADKLVKSAEGDPSSASGKPSSIAC